MPTILAVDDDARILSLMERVLKDDFEVLTGSSVEDALRVASEKSFQIVLTDFCMPGGSGLELARALRRSGHSVPIVLVTAATESPEILDALRSGLISGLVEKPWSITRLVSKVVEVAGIARTAA